MSDRTVMVRLKAEVSGFQAAMAASGASAQRAQADLERMQEHGSTALGRLATSADLHKDAWEKSGMALLGFGAAAVAGVGLAVKTFADFSSQMAQVQSLSHASSSDMDALTQAALNMGQSIGFSASEVAAGEIEMVKAGISVKDMLGGAMAGALTLAAAGQIDVAQATEIATIAMTQFGLAGKDIPHVADLLSAGADKALGGVSELGWALKSGGLVAHQFGLSLDDTVGTLSLFAQNGLLGEAAGTDLRQMLLKLAAPSKTASADMEKLGMVLYDSSGHFVGITALAGQLHDKMKNLSESERNAMEAHIFGARSIVGANILYQAGAAGVQGWIDSVNDSGFAAKQAAGKMDSLNGDMKKLSAAWETGMIEMGSTADGFLRPLIQNVTGAVHGFDQLPNSTKGLILGFSAAAGATALVVGGFLTLTPKVFDVIQGFKQLAADGSAIPGVLGKIGIAAGIAVAAIAGLSILDSVLTESNTKSATDYTNAIIGLSKAGAGVKNANLDTVFQGFDKFAGNDVVVGVNSLSDAVHKLTHQSFDNVANKFLGPVTDLLHLPKDQIRQLEDRLHGLGDAMGSLVTSGNAPMAAESFKKLTTEFEKNGKGAQDALDSVPGYKDALLAQAAAAKQSLEPNELLAYAAGQIPEKMLAAGDAVGVYTTSTGQAAPLTKELQKTLADMGLSADGTTDSLDKLVKSMEQAGLIQISADEALSSYYASLDAVDASIQKNGKSLDIHTEKGRANQKALDDVAKAGLNVVQANAKNGASQEELGKNLNTTYLDLLANYAAFGITGDKADTMARQVMGIPKGVPIDIAIQNYADSMLKLNGIATAADNAARNRTSTIFFQTDASGFYDPSAGTDGHGAGSGGKSKGPGAFAAGGLIGFATGGMVGGFPGGGLLQGPGTGTSDSMIARVSNGEFIQPEKAVKKYGVPFMEQVRAGTYQPAPAYMAASFLGRQGQQAGSGQANGAVQMVGTLVMDSGEVMGTFRGIARQEASGAIEAANRDAGTRPAR